MTQNASDVEIANQGFAAFRQDLNDVLEDITTLHSGTAAPSTTYANMLWYETDSGIVYIRNNDNDAWIEIFTLDQVNDKIAKLNMNGGEIVLDADDDTSITADTDDRIDFKVAGVDSVYMTSSGLGIGDTAPVTPLTITTTNKLGSTFTGTTNGEGLTVTQTNYTSGNYVSLVESAYDDSGDTAPNVRIAAMYDGGGSNLAFGTSNSFGSGVTNTAMFIDSSGSVGIGTDSPSQKLDVSGAGARIYLNDANEDIDMNSTADGQLRLDGSGYAGAIALNTAGMNIYTNASSRGIIFGVNETERMRIDSSGNVLVGATSSAIGNVGFKFNSTGFARSERSGTSSQGHIAFTNANGDRGSITTNSTSTQYNTTSDYRLKENVTDITDGIERVKQLNPSRFNFIVDADTTVDGFLAHEAATVVPEAVHGTHNETEAIGDITDADNNTVETGVVEPDTLEDGHTWTETGTQPVYQGIDQAKLVPLLTAALQEAITKIEALETQNADFETRLTALEN